MERRKREAEARGDTTGAAALAQQIEAQRREAEAHDRHERERIQRERPDRLPDFDQVQQDTRRRALESRLNPHAPQADGPVDISTQIDRDQLRTRDIRAAVHATTSDRATVATVARTANEGDALLADVPLPRPTGTPTATAAATSTAPATQVATVSPRAVAAPRV